MRGLGNRKTTRLNWAKLIVPDELADLLYMVAKAKGFKREDLHFFLYSLLKTAHPEDVEKLTDYLEARWMESKPPPPPED